MSRRVDRKRNRDGTALREMIAGRKRRQHASGSNCMGPRSGYEAVTRQMVRSLRDEIRDVKQRVNQLVTLVVGAILLEAFMRLMGVGM
jgi:hypothetical protein